MSRLQAYKADVDQIANDRELLSKIISHLNQPAALVDTSGAVVLKNAPFETFSSDAVVREAIVSSAVGGVTERPFADLSRWCVQKSTHLACGILVTIETGSDQSEERLRAFEQARLDPLTLLGNRLMLTERLAQSLSARDQALSLFAIDLDRFKAVNDSLGHHIGDKLLGKVAERISSTLGPDDYAARFGGDEFCVVQAGAPEGAAEAMAERLIDLLGRSYLLDGHLINVSASVGIAAFPDDGGDEHALMKNADLALYQAKAQGRGCFRRFEQSMDDAMQARRTMEIDLRKALALREFALVYQPQYNVRSKRVTGFEALLRWNHPTQGVVSPMAFIPIAEETGLIVAIGEWVLRTACRQAASWTEPLKIAVNVSAAQFSNANLVATVISALAESGLAPHRLELEITESVLMDDHSAALSVLRSIREIGVRISMDDFGTGYSSLSYLQSFPFDKIKIDQSFVRGEHSGPSNIAIVRAIAAMGQSLGMSTTAEGVETEDQLASVMENGCTDVQGYLISKPLPPTSLDQFFSSAALSGIEE